MKNKQADHANNALESSRRHLLKGFGLGLGATILYGCSNDSSDKAITNGGTLPEPGAEETELPQADGGFTPVYYPKADFTAEVDLAGKTAIVTGASRGIGRTAGVAEHFT